MFQNDICPIKNSNPIRIVVTCFIWACLWSCSGNAPVYEDVNRNEKNADHYSHLYAHSTDMPAFPGAQGPGSTTPGGRGGTIYKVTSLADYYEDEEPVPGTLRYALEQEGPRIVVFGVGGTIRLKRPLVVTNPYLTVAGNTAPFPGITVFAYPTSIRADHVILRYLRFRLDVEVMRERFAKGLDSGWDSVNAGRCEYVIFDHVSASHSVDETISFSGHVDHVTLSNSISAYSLRSVFHDYYFTHGPDYRHAQTHNLGGLIAYLGKHDSHATGGSYHNIWAHHDRRMPGLSAGRDDPDNLVSFIDIRNSVMYNWKSNAAGIETGSVDRSKYHINFIGNYFKPGPNTPADRRYAGLKVMGLNKVYMEDNLHDDDAIAGQATIQEKLLLDLGRMPEGEKRLLENPLPVPLVTTQTPPELAAIANDFVGASIPVRDDIDHLVIMDIFNGTGHHPFADMEQDDSPPVLELPTVSHVYASDDDPFPIWWKRMQGLSANDRIDPQADSNGDGYTNIETYIYGLNLHDNPVDWTKIENNRNPLAQDRIADHKLPHLATLELSEKDWSNHDTAETIYSSADGLILMASSTATNTADPQGCRWILSDGPGFWSAGSGNQQAPGPLGAVTEDGSALVMAFPLPQKLIGIRIAKPYPEAYSSDHDPANIVVQGLRGWPKYWVDLTETTEVPSFSENNHMYDIILPEDRRSHFSAYRIVFTNSRGDADVRIQSLSLLPLDSYVK